PRGGVAMTQKFLGAAAVGVLCFSTSMAGADTHSIIRSGSWEAFGGTTSGKNRGVCGISSNSKGDYFGFKMFAGDETFTIQIGKKSWNIADGAKQTLTMQFDKNSKWNATGTGMHFNDGDAGLEFTVARKEMLQFMHEFADSRHLEIKFGTAKVTPWEIGLAGVKKVEQAFDSCVSKLK
ncbi:MAG: hypothetical protein ACREFC_11830, partial [Stellaceae bacterium]